MQYYLTPTQTSAKPLNCDITLLWCVTGRSQFCSGPARSHGRSNVRGSWCSAPFWSPP